MINTQRVLRYDHVLLMREVQSMSLSYYRVVCILQIFYVYNALHGATLANSSHFQYVSRLRLRVIWIGVKACTDVTLYAELFYHLYNRETFP